jgi:hypothetical protein
VLIPVAAALALTILPIDPFAGPLTVDYPVKGGSVLLYTGETVVTWLEQTKLDPEARETFDGVFTDQGYFGAWAMSDNGGYGYAAGAGTIEAAREIAMAQCEASNDGCRMVAELFPADFYAPGPQDITLSQQQTVEFNTPDRGSFRAMAVGEDGAYAVNWGFASQAEADAASMADCTASMLVLDLPGLRAMPCILLREYP